MSFEGGEHDAAFARLVAVLEQETGHDVSMPPKSWLDIGATP